MIMRDASTTIYTDMCFLIAWLPFLIFGRNAKLKRSLAVGSDNDPGSTFLISNARPTLQAALHRNLGLEFLSSNAVGLMGSAGPREASRWPILLSRPLLVLPKAPSSCWFFNKSLQVPLSRVKARWLSRVGRRLPLKHLYIPHTIRVALPQICFVF